MMAVKAKLFFICLLLNGYLQVVRSEDLESFASRLAVEETANADVDGKRCPGVEGCLDNCILGRKRDENGCFTCACNHSGEFEGDIEITEDNYWRMAVKYEGDEILGGGLSREQRGARRGGASEWPRVGETVEVAYTLHTTITSQKEMALAIMKAIDDYKEQTCIRFVPKKKSHNDYVLFYGRGVCSSVVGRSGGVQLIRLGYQCKKYGTIIHEMMHSLGFWHEHSRGDRDKFITVKWNNILNGKTRNFLKMQTDWDSYGSPYDLKSVMHYGGEFFAKNPKLPTLVDKQGKTVEAQRVGFSYEDLRQINIKYNCPDFYLKKLKEKYRHNTVVIKKIHNALDLGSKKTECKNNEDTDCTRTDRCAYPKYKKLCPITCGVCKGGSSDSSGKTCVDKKSNCQVDANKGYCKRFSSMKTVCAKSCGFCGTTSVPSPKPPPKPSPKESCKDSYSRCKSQYCSDPKFKTSVGKYCRQTCGLC